ncbi:hypothetical protein AK88_05388 [Plasmodium fragile]|uniref:Uncharacterized protein n=1 Tax=Plasmodium fragile TaxID=5857 RepID=A0A0D9QD86_PLAFR|nr:uncharacterized protein AK88_05388 [Plasmodium fragile]KJP84978.1 hypothetical protein AK88_05388 [Plasmodium fragile]
MNIWYPNNPPMNNITSLKNQNVLSRRESFNKDPFAIRKNNLKTRDNASPKHGSLNKKKDLNNKRTNVLQKHNRTKENDLLRKKSLKEENFIRTRSAVRKKVIIPLKYNNSINDTAAIDRREILQKRNLLIKKVDIRKDIQKPTPESNSSEKIDVETTAKNKLPESDLPDEFDKAKIEQIFRKKKWTVEIYMSENKGKDKIITSKKKKKTTIISTHMCEKTKQGELIDILDSKSNDDKIGEQKIAGKKKFTINIHLDKKKKAKLFIKKKKCVIEAIMKNASPQKLEILEQHSCSNIIDVDVKDPLYPTTQEAVFECILASSTETPSRSRRKRRVQILRKWGIYGLIPIVAIGAIIGCTIGYIHVMPVDVIFDSTAVGVQSTVESVVQNVPGIAAKVGKCVVDTAKEALGC